MPIFKRSGNKIFGCQFNAKENEALLKECLRQEAEYTRKYEVEIEALVLRQVRRRLSYGEKRLKQFYDDFDNDLQELIKHYEMGEEDTAWLATQELKAEGIDVEKWHREKYGD